MIMKKSALFCSALLLVAACTVSEPVLEEGKQISPAEKALVPAYNDGTLLVQFDDDMVALLEAGSSLRTKAPDVDALLQEMGVSSLERVFPNAGPFEERTRREGLHRFYRIRFDSGMPVTKASEGLQGLPGVVTAHPELPVRSRAAYYNDPYFTSQWHYINTRYTGSDINIQPVWEQFTKGDPKVIVSVVDEGIDFSHPDLAANLVPAYDDGTGSWNFTNDTPKISPSSSHGTHVAGTICAISNNGIGVAGVAGGDAAAGVEGVKVLSCQIFGGYGTPNIYQAMKHGADHGAVILQCSWGFSPDVDGDGFTSDAEMEAYNSWTIDDLPEYKAAIDYFIKYAGCDNRGNQLPDSPMKGGVVIFASGNDNYGWDPMVSYDEVIAVGAFGATGNKASYSNWGDWVDIAAPGGDGKQGIYSTLMGGSYGGNDWLGTSFACPHVSGVAALLISYFGGPGFTAAECKSRLLRGAVPNAFSGSRYIGKKLDALGAFTCDINAPVLPPVVTWASSLPTTAACNQTVELPFTVSDPAGERVFVELLPEGHPGVSLVTEDAYKVVVDASCLAAGKHSFTVRATNEDHLQAEISHTLTVLPNAAPVLQEGGVSQMLLTLPGESKSLSLDGMATDPEGEELSYSVNVVGSVVEATVSGATLTVKPLALGEETLQLVFTDPKGNQATANLTVKVVDATVEVTVYPNPVTDLLYVGTATEAQQTFQVKLTSQTGALVLSTEAKADAFTPATLNLAGLAPGLYQLCLTNEEGRVVMNRSLTKM